MVGAISALVLAVCLALLLGPPLRRALGGRAPPPAGAARRGPDAGAAGAECAAREEALRAQLRASEEAQRQLVCPAPHTPKPAPPARAA